MQKFICVSDGMDMVEDKDGDWVHQSDVAGLLLEIEHIKEEHANQITQVNNGWIAACKERDTLRDRYDREVLGLNNEGDPIGGEPAGGLLADLKSMTKERDTLRDILKLLVPDLKLMAAAAQAMGNTARAQALNNICKGVDL